MNDFKDFKDVDQIVVKEETDLILNTKGLLEEVRSRNDIDSSMIIPIGQLTSLGTGIASLIPILNKVSSNTGSASCEIYRVANQAVGDVLKQAKNGNFYGSLKTADGNSKMAQFTKLNDVSGVSNTISSINPATVMMAATLYSIDKQLAEISETQRQILSFLEIRDEANVEGDLETLTELITNYKHNWDNDVYVQSSHKLVMDIKRTSRSNMINNQKKIEDIIKKKKLVVAQAHMKSNLLDLENRFKYYKLSLYTYSLASLVEIMMGGNFKYNYLEVIRKEIITLSEKYRDLFDKGSIYLEKLGSSSVESNLLKGIGVAGKKFGKMVGSIPVLKEGNIDEFLHESGSSISDNADKLERKAVKQFAKLSNPGTRVVIERVSDLMLIHNETAQMLFDNTNIFIFKK